jgi:hypothetical protein
MRVGLNQSLAGHLDANCSRSKGSDENNDAVCMSSTTYAPISTSKAGGRHCMTSAVQCKFMSAISVHVLSMHIRY